jgi:hypothetical protein
VIEADSPSVVVYGGADMPHHGAKFFIRWWQDTPADHGRIAKDAPLGRAVQRSGVIITIPILSGLHHQYVRI